MITAQQSTLTSITTPLGSHHTHTKIVRHGTSWELYWFMHPLAVLDRHSQPHPKLGECRVFTYDATRVDKALSISCPFEETLLAAKAALTSCHNRFSANTTNHQQWWCYAEGFWLTRRRCSSLPQFRSKNASLEPQLILRFQHRI